MKNRTNEIRSNEIRIRRELPVHICNLNSISGDIMLDGLAGSGGVVGGGMAAGGVVTGSGGNVVDMLEIPGKGIY